MSAKSGPVETVMSWMTWTVDTKTITAKGKDLAASILQDAVGEALDAPDMLDELCCDVLEGGQNFDSLLGVLGGFEALLFLELCEKSFALGEFLVGREGSRDGRSDTPLARSCHGCAAGWL